MTRRHNGATHRSVPITFAETVRYQSAIAGMRLAKLRDIDYLGQRVLLNRLLMRCSFFLRVPIGCYGQCSPRRYFRDQNISIERRETRKNEISRLHRFPPLPGNGNNGVLSAIAASLSAAHIICLIISRYRRSFPKCAAMNVTVTEVTSRSNVIIERTSSEANLYHGSGIAAPRADIRIHFSCPFHPIPRIVKSSGKLSAKRTCIAADCRILETFQLRDSSLPYQKSIVRFIQNSILRYERGS